MALPKSFGYGTHGELFVKQLFEQAGIECEKNPDVATRLDYDLVCKVGRTKFTCEVKFDLMAARTGNVAIEFHNTKKDAPSGLNATKANIWAHLIYDDSNKTVWITSVSKLRKYCTEVVPKRIVKNAGDNNANLLLYPCDAILADIFHRIENVEGNEVTKILKELLKHEKNNPNTSSITCK